MRKQPIKYTSKIIRNGKQERLYGKCSKCEVSICDKKSKLCWKCHIKNRPPETRFWKKVNKTKSCWLWTGALAGSNLYGNFWDGKRYTSAHRYSWHLHRGIIKKGLLVCHTCDTPMCVNPEHLFVGTDKENKKDSVDKKRHAFGERSGQAKLKEKEIIEIRKLFPEFSQVELSKKYGVHVHTIGHVISRRWWKHIKP